MRADCLILACLLGLVGGCGAARGNAIRPGTTLARVQVEYGTPDVIYEASADEGRYYAPANRPAYEWPADARRTFYYLQRDVGVTFVSGKVTHVAPIDPALRERVLLPLLRRQGGADSRQ